MKVLTGDETGLLKIVNLQKKSVVTRAGEQKRTRGIVDVAWLGDTAAFASLSRGGAVDVWDSNSGKHLRAYKNAGENGVFLARRAHGFTTVSASGTVRVFDDNIVDADESGSKFEVGNNVHTACTDSSVTHLAVGGREHDVSLWDITRGCVTFEARNVANTKLDLRVPIWVTALQFLQPSDGGNVIVASTGYKHVRVYDIRSGRRPVRMAEIGDYPFTVLSVSKCDGGRSIVTGDTAGTLRRIDVGTLRQIGGYDGVSGSLRSISMHPSQPYFASVSLDRCLRVHNLETRELLRRVFLKQRLTAVAFPSPPAMEKGASISSSANDIPGQNTDTSCTHRIDSQATLDPQPQTMTRFARVITGSGRPQSVDPRFPASAAAVAVESGSVADTSAAWQKPKVGDSDSESYASDVWADLDTRAQMADGSHQSNRAQLKSVSQTNGAGYLEDTGKSYPERSKGGEIYGGQSNDDGDGGDDDDDDDDDDGGGESNSEEEQDDARALVDSKTAQRALLRQVTDHRRLDQMGRRLEPPKNSIKKPRR